MVVPQQKSEPLLAENPDRFCMFPIKYHAVWEMYKKAEASFWTGVGPDRPLLRCYLYFTADGWLTPIL
jgi:hypothetical protein